MCSNCVMEIKRVSSAIALCTYLKCVAVSHVVMVNYYSPVDLAEKKGEPGKNSKKADFGIIRNQTFHRSINISSLGKNFYAHFNIGTCIHSSLYCMMFLGHAYIVHYTV